MQFQVPQFIEVEDKIFGPLTFKQFVYLGGGLGAGYILWRILPVFLSAPLIIVIVGLAAALSFIKFNGRPFIIGLENAFFFLIHSKLYLWNNEKKSKKKAKKEEKTEAVAEVYVPKLSDSKLHELAWSLDIKERIAAGVADEEERTGAHPQPAIVAPSRTARDALGRDLPTETLGRTNVKAAAAT